MSTTTRAHCSATRGRRAESVSAAGVSKVVAIIVPRCACVSWAEVYTHHILSPYHLGGRADMWLFSSYPEEQTGRGFPGRAGQCTGQGWPVYRAHTSCGERWLSKEIELIKSAGKRVCHMRLVRPIVVSKIGPGTGPSLSVQPLISLLVSLAGGWL